MLDLAYSWLLWIYLVLRTLLSKDSYNKWSFNEEKNKISGEGPINVGIGQRLLP